MCFLYTVLIMLCTQCVFCPQAQGSYDDQAQAASKWDRDASRADLNVGTANVAGAGRGNFAGGVANNGLGGGAFGGLGGNGGYPRYSGYSGYGYNKY
jgi:hypothetical protein